MMNKIPARCNRRECQGRRNIDSSYLTAAPHQMPKCKKCGDGVMYVDRYRLNKGSRDNAPICADLHCPAAERLALANNGRVFPHRVSTRDCNGYQDHVINSAIKDSKHKPFRDNEPTKGVPF